MESFLKDCDDDASIRKIEDSNDDYDQHDTCSPRRHCDLWGCPVLDIAREDDVDRFLESLRKDLDSPDAAGQNRSWKFQTNSLGAFILHHSVKCISQVVDHVDFDRPHQRSGLPPLHIAICWSCLPLVEMFLKHNAPTNYRCQIPSMEHYEMLPLNYSLYVIGRFLIDFDILTPEQSVYKMLILLCLPELRTRLQIVRLLARETDELGDEIYYYAKHGRLVELAILLLVAREKVMSVSLVKKSALSQSGYDSSGLDQRITLRDFVISQLAQLYALQVKLKVFNASNELLIRCREKQNLMHSTLLLLEIFCRAGETIDSCLDEQEQMTQEEVVEKVSLALKEAGFRLDDKDMDVSHVKSCPWPLRYLHSQQKFHNKNAERSYQLGTSLSFGIYANWRKDSISQRPQFNAIEYMEPDGPLDEVLESSLRLPFVFKEKEKRLSSEELVIALLCELRNLNSEVQETVMSHLGKKEQIAELVCYYVKKGNLVKVAALLFLGWKKSMTSDSSDSKNGPSFDTRKIHQFIMSEVENLIANEMKQLGNNDAEEFTKIPTGKECLSTDMESLLRVVHLLEALERAGDNLDEYIDLGHTGMTEEDCRCCTFSFESKKASPCICMEERQYFVSHLIMLTLSLIYLPQLAATSSN